MILAIKVLVTMEIRYNSENRMYYVVYFIACFSVNIDKMRKLTNLGVVIRKRVNYEQNIMFNIHYTSRNYK